jgi:hypothetical protein
MKGLTAHTHYTITFSPVQWDLYTSMEGVNDVAADLNVTLQKSLNAGFSRDIVESHMQRVMRQHDSFGANDTEPHAFLQFVLDKAFNKF